MLNNSRDARFAHHIVLIPANLTFRLKQPIVLPASGMSLLGTEEPREFP
jgi:hypothetical protein